MSKKACLEGILSRHLHILIISDQTLKLIKESHSMFYRLNVYSGLKDGNVLNET